LISLPRPTQMLHFGRFALPSEKQGSSRRDLIRKSWDQRSHAPTPGLSQLATSFITYQAESFVNRRLCTITGPTPFCCFVCFLLLQPRKLYANMFSVKPHFFRSTLSVRHCGALLSSVILCTTVIAGVPAASFISHFHRRLHTYCSVTRTRPISTLYTKLPGPLNLGGDPAAGSPTTTLLRLLPRC
jgi:hypothetical protein